MHVYVHYQNLDNSPWVNQFVEDRVHKLDKFFDPATSVQVNLRYENNSYVTSIAIHNPNHDYAFISYGLNLFDSLATAVDKANRKLGEQKKKMKDRIHRRIFAQRNALA